MKKWLPLKTPRFCERLIGFSVPFGGASLVISYEGVHLMHLGEPITVDTDAAHPEYRAYDPDVGVAEYRGIAYRIIGLHGGTPLTETPQGERLELDPQAQNLAVIAASERTLEVGLRELLGRLGGGDVLAGWTAPAPRLPVRCRLSSVAAGTLRLKATMLPARARVEPLGASAARPTSGGRLGPWRTGSLTLLLASTHCPSASRLSTCTLSGIASWRASTRSPCSRNTEPSSTGASPSMTPTPTAYGRGRRSRRT